MSGLIRDVRGALRALRRAPGFTLVATLTLALGIGANTAVFSFADPLLLRALPYDDPDALMRVWGDFSEAGGAARSRLTLADLGDFRSEPDLFAALAGWEARDPTLSAVGGAEVIRAAAVTEGMFSRVLRVSPMLGRSFLPEEDRPGGTRAVIISQSFWTGRMGADPGVLGRAVTLDGIPYTVIGVMPPGFRPPFAPEAALWVTVQLERRRCRDCDGFHAVGRLAPGTSIPIANDRANAVSQRLAEAYPLTNEGMGLTIVGLREDLTGQARGLLRLLFAGTGLVLLIACANVANLILTRGVRRRPEFTLRVALGARRGTLLAQLLTESAVLAAAGGMLALGVAAWSTELFVRLAPRGVIPGGIEVDRRILGFNVMLVLLTAVALGVLPALSATRRNRGIPNRRSIVPERRSPGEGPSVQGSLVVAQVAVAMVLTLGATTVLQGFQQLQDTDLGFDARGVLVMTFQAVPGATRTPGVGTLGVGILGVGTPGGGASLRDDLLTPLADLPRTMSVGATTVLPFVGSDEEAAFRIEGRPDRGEVAQTAAVRRVAGAYFYTMGQRLLDGRSFTAEDGAAAVPPLIVNESFAKRFLGYPYRSAMRAHIALGRAAEPVWRPVVGVVHDVRHEGPRARPAAAVYAPYRGEDGPIALVMKTDGDPLDVVGAARDVVSGVVGLSAAVAPTRTVAMEELTSEAIAIDRFATSLLTAFATLALALAGVGLYGVLSHRVNGRSVETGIRLALGAGIEEIRGRVVGAGLRFTLLGIVLGVGVAASLSGLVGRVVEGVQGGDPVSLFATASVLLGVAFASSWLPARRAAGVDPVAALRDE